MLVGSGQRGTSPAVPQEANTNPARRFLGPQEIVGVQVRRAANGRP
jgi:hypothetical protein